MQDVKIVCQGPNRETPCPNGATFVHTVKDQQFYQRQGFEAPKRCPDCRKAKKSIYGDGPKQQLKSDREEFGDGR